MGNLSFETAKALKVNGAKTTIGFNAGPRRSNVLNSLKDGGEYTVPEYKEVINSPIRNQYEKDENDKFKMDAMGNKIPVMVQHIFAQDATGNCVPLYPGTFSKSRQEVKLENGVYIRGKFFSASGDVVSWLDNNFLETEDAMQALVTATLPKGQENPNASEAVKKVVPVGLGRKIRVTMNPINTVRYEANGKSDDQLTKSDIRQENIPTFTWIEG